MKRIAITVLVLVVMAMGATPAKAYCIVNQTPDTLYATLANFNPLADFDKTIKPGKTICCDWFDRRCNPSGTRGALVDIFIEGEENRLRWEKAARQKVQNRRKGRTVRGVLNALTIPEKFSALYCLNGLKRSVLASSGGTIVISRDPTKQGKLNCASRDHFLRPVNSNTRRTRNYTPLWVAPRLKREPRQIPTIREQLLR